MDKESDIDPLWDSFWEAHEGIHNAEGLRSSKIFPNVAAYKVTEQYFLGRLEILQTNLNKLIVGMKERQEKWDTDEEKNKGKR